jgi:hypothetical protein
VRHPLLHFGHRGRFKQILHEKQPPPMSPSPPPRASCPTTQPSPRASTNVGVVCRRYVRVRITCGHRLDPTAAGRHMPTHLGHRISRRWPAALCHIRRRGQDDRPEHPCRLVNGEPSARLDPIATCEGNQVASRERRV